MATENQTASICSSPLKINILGVSKEQRQAIIFNPRCKNWECPHCAEMNKDFWMHRAARGTSILLMEGHELRFITVTSRPYATPVTSVLYFGQNWPKLNRRALYHTNKTEHGSWAYFLIPERTKAGVLHAHLIAATHLKARWWKDNAYKTGFGYQAKSKIIQTPGAASGYVAKYLGKDVMHTGWPAGFRRVRSSRNWPAAKPKQIEGWEWSSHGEESIWFEKHILQDAGFHVIDKRSAGDIDNHRYID